MFVGLVGLGVGGAFLGIDFTKNNQITTYLRAEKVILGLSGEEIASGNAVDTLAEAQKAAETLTSHRMNIAPTYNDLLAGGRFEPTNPKQLTYAQAMNLQTNVYTAVPAFGLAQSIMANAAYLVASGMAFIIIGVVLYRLAGKSIS